MKIGELILEEKDILKRRKEENYAQKMNEMKFFLFVQIKENKKRFAFNYCQKVFFLA